MLRTRPLDPGVDRERLVTLCEHAPKIHRHSIDLPYRLCSPSAYKPDHTCIWEDANGQLVGFAIIQRQFWTIDYGFDPAYPFMFRTVLAWVEQQMPYIASAERDQFPEGLRAFCDCYADDSTFPSELEAYGYAFYPEWQQTHRWQYVEQWEMPIDQPSSFTIRACQGAHEATECARVQRAAFASDNMTDAWRQCLMNVAEYQPDLDLVALSPSGEIVGFCLGWQQGNKGQIEPLVVHPDFQHKGLGRALLRSCLARMIVRGVRIVHIENDGSDSVVARFYASEGFTQTRQVLKYMRLFLPL